MLAPACFPGGAVRYRIYSSWNMNALEVAKLCFIAGLTFWLGNIAVLGLGIAWHPEVVSRIDLLPPSLNRTLALGALALLVAYVAWVTWRSQTFGRGQWAVKLPGGGLTLVQILIGIVDLLFCSLAMYMLLPATPAGGGYAGSGRVRVGDFARLRQPCAGRYRRV